MMCPKCHAPLIHFMGSGVDYDRDDCSNKECGYSHIYKTSSMPCEPRITLIKHVRPGDWFIDPNTREEFMVMKHLNNGKTQADGDDSIKIFLSYTEVELNV